MLWGITGCSGTGASTVAEVWKRMGASVCSLDSVGHGFLEKTAVREALEKILLIDGMAAMSADAVRKELREKAFSSPEVLQGINSVLHPRLVRWVTVSAGVLKENRGVFVLDAALIFELRLEKYLNYVVTVTDQLERVTSRLAHRDGVSPETVSGRWRSQLALEEKTARSHFVIRNADTEDILKKNAEQFYTRVIQRMEEPGGTQNQKKAY
ncbi:MAG: dephospho-CoA kinase [Candidatus Fermentibacteraceae bacterium]|nr:dephospho-CoA kinase [Candidatus Fermentibacteraceae bacterium]